MSEKVSPRTFSLIIFNKYHKVFNLIMNRDVMQIQNSLLQQQITGMQKQINIMEEQIKYLYKYIDNIERTYIVTQ